MNKKTSYQNQTVYFRAEHKTAYTVITNSLIQDKNLSFTEVGIMTYLLSLPKDWVVNKTQIQKESGLGLVAFNKAWKRLEEMGYIVRTAIKGGYCYEIIEKPLANGINILRSLNVTTVKKWALQSKHYNKVNTLNKPEIPEGPFQPDEFFPKRAPERSPSSSVLQTENKGMNPELVLNNNFAEDIPEDLGTFLIIKDINLEDD